MHEPVKLELSKKGALLEEWIALDEQDLNCRIEMLTGIGWFDAMPQYQTLMASRREHVTQSYRVCHSYEKWGDLQQEVQTIKLCMRRIGAY